MKKYLILLIILCSLNSVYSQRNIDYKQLVGFACFSGGSKSEAVIKFSKLIQKSNYKAIVKLLDSENAAEKYLAVIVSERLDRENKFELTEIEKLKINKIKTLEVLVQVCSGCTYFDKIPLKKLFVENENNYMNAYAQDWLDRVFKNNSY